jgi:hypothetical protein
VTLRSPGQRSKLAAAVAAIAAIGLTAAAPATAASAASAHRTQHRAGLTVVYRNLALLNGETATVYSNGLAEVWNADRSQVEYRTIPPTGAGEAGTATALPGQAQLRFDLIKAPPQAYLPGTLEVVLSPTVTAAPRRQAAGGYTTDAAVNRVLTRIGADSMSPVFPAGAVRALKPQAGRLDLARAYVVHFTAATMPGALAALAASGGVAYAAPDWTVSTTVTNPVPIPARTQRAADALARRLATARHNGTNLPPLPSNFALTSSAQSLLNKPGIDWTPAYEAVEAKYHELPGTGETITDVSLGDLDSAGISRHNSCYGYVNAFGPTTVIKNGQRYLDWPSMPLIPTYTASDQAALNPAGQVCGVDPFDEEIGLDFAMMAPLPHNRQRAGEAGSGLTDLLGIAPGAHFRLVVPSDTSGAITTLDESFLAAGQQTPRPNVITASLAFGLDSEGFPSRYLEDDPLTESLISSLVRQYHINVAISANDGLRSLTNAAVSPSGGSAPTNTEPAGGTPSNLNSIQLSTAPSSDYDSGAIDVGGTTLDDIFAAPPQDPANAALASQHAFAETRWDGYGAFSSGFGTRVNISAPADNLIAFEHAQGGAADAVNVDNIGGTSGSSQEVGAAAAVVQQVARLAGDKNLAGSPLAVRRELDKTATRVPGVPQADRRLNVGPQLDLGKAVTSLTGRPAPGVARVAVEQRQPDPGLIDAVFFTATDPGAISLSGPDQDAWLTIAPDWVGLPADATFKLAAVRETGGQKVLATGPWARLLPDAIFAAAGVSPPTTQAQAVALVYTASSGGRVIAKTTIPLSFAPVSGTPEALAPVVPPVVTGATIPVRYDLTGQSGFTAPQLVVSAPGRMNPFDDHFFRDAYTVPLTQTSGTVNVPVAALSGGGIYGIAIQATPTAFEFSDFAYTRVQGAPTDVRPPAPVLSVAGAAPGYLESVRYGGTFTVRWNVSGVPGATGAYLEVSAPGPNDFNSFATFNNPNGTVRDHNGYDSGSLYFQPLTGTKGTTTLPAATAGLYPTMYSQVRVLPVTSDGTAAGEASDVSTISMNGVAPADGGATVDGFGVEQDQPAGFVTSNQTNASNQSHSSVETFDQQTQAITHTVRWATASDSYTTLDDGGPGIFAGDTGLIQDSTAATTHYDVLSPLTQVARRWKPPTANSFIQPADNQQTATAAFGTWDLGRKGATHVGVFGSDVQAGTSGPVYSAEPALQGFGLPVVTGIAQDTAANTAVLNVTDFTNTGVPPTFVTVDLATGATRTFAGAGSGVPDGLAIDSGTGMAANPEISGVALIDLADGNGTLATPGGFVYQHPAANPATRQFLVQEVSPPDANIVTPGLGAVPNDNALSTEVLLDEQGNVVSRIEQFNFFNVFTSINGQLTQLGSTPGQAYTTGVDGFQVQPFSYP